MQASYLFVLLGCLGSLAGCPVEDDEPDVEPGDDDTSASLPACEPDDVHDPDLPVELLAVFPDGCVPEACGVGRWGNLEVGEGTVHVDAGASGGGDGSEAAPFTSIQAGLARAAEADSGRVVVAAGTYVENLQLTEGQDGVHLCGRCQELAVLDGSEGEEDDAGVRATGFMGDEEWVISGLTVTGAPQVGIRLDSGDLTLDSTSVDSNRVIGVWADGHASHLRVEDSTVTSTLRNAFGQYGHGIQVTDGALLEAESSTVVGSENTGIIAGGDGTELLLDRVEIRGSLDGVEGDAGRGIELQTGARLEARSCRLSGNAGCGILALDPGTEVVLTDVEILDTTQGSEPEGGRGIEVQLGSRLEAHSCQLAGNSGIGISITDAGTEAVLVSVEIRDTLLSEAGDGGVGIGVKDGASLEADSCLLVGNTEAGVAADGIVTEVRLDQVQILATGRGPFYTVGVGLVSQNGASVSAANLLVEQTEGPALFCNNRGGLTCGGCELSDNAFAGAVVWAGGVIDLSNTVISGTTVDAGEGGGVGIYASDRFFPSTLVVESTTIEDHPYAALWLDGAGSYTIRDSTLVGGYGEEIEHFDGTSTTLHGDAVVATSGAEGLWLENNRIQGAVRAGVLLDGSTAWLSGNTYSDNATDLVWQDCAGVEEPADLDEVPSYDDRCTTSTLPIAPLEFNYWLEEGEIRE